MSLFGANRTKLVRLESTIQQGEFSQLLLLVHILLIVNDLQHFRDHRTRRIDRRRIVPRNQNVQWLIVRRHDLAVPTTPGAFLDGPSTANGNFAARLGFQFLLCLSTGTNDESNEVVIGMFVNGNGYLLDAFAHEGAGGPTGELEDAVQEVLTLVGVFFPPADGAGVLAFAVGVVDCESRMSEKVG